MAETNINIPIENAVTDGSLNPVTSNAVFDGLATKQSTLVSGTNIKTVGSQTVLGAGNVSQMLLDFLEFDLAAVTTSGIGRLRWNDEDGTLNLGLKGGNVSLQIGQETVVRVVNKTGVNLLESQYKAVYIDGAQGNRLSVALADNTTLSTSNTTLGVVTENIDNNLEGFITTSGLVRGINTTGTLQGQTWLDGDIIYLGSAGNLTNIPPTGATAFARIGYVVRAHATQGSIFVKVLPSFRLAELHDVTITGVANNDAVQYDSASGEWINRAPDTTPTLASIKLVTSGGVATGLAAKIAKHTGATYSTNALQTVTAAEYAAIVTKDPSTIYFIV